MKKKLCSKNLPIFIMAIVLIFSISCEKNSLELPLKQHDEENLVEKKVFVKNGVLCFSNWDAFYKTKKELSRLKSEEQRLEWQRALSFNSIAGYRAQAEKIIIENIINYKKNGYTRQQFIKELKQGKIEEIPQEAESLLKKGSLIVKTNEDNSKSVCLPFSTGAEPWFLNENYAYAIGDSLHVFNKGNCTVTTNWDILKNNGKTLKYHELGRSHYQLGSQKSTSNSDYKLIASLHARRIIYWAYSEDDPWTIIELFIEYTIQKKVWWWWDTKDWYNIKDGGTCKYFIEHNWQGWETGYSKRFHDNWETDSHPYYIIRSWARDGDFPWIRIKDAFFEAKLSRDDLTVDLRQREQVAPNGPIFNPCKLLNYDGEYYDRDRYIDPPE